jgi:uncharacterized membrane protein YbhN (UPF0104 family)
MKKVAIYLLLWAVFGIAVFVAFGAENRHDHTVALIAIGVAMAVVAVQSVWTIRDFLRIGKP